MPWIRSCSARMVSVNDGYFEFDDAVVAAAVVNGGGGGRGDLVVTALEDCAYSVLLDRFAMDVVGAVVVDSEGGGGGVALRLITGTAIVVVAGGGAGVGGGGTVGTLNLNGSTGGCSGGSGMISVCDSSLFVTVLFVRRLLLTDVERSFATVKLKRLRSISFCCMIMADARELASRRDREWMFSSGRVDLTSSTDEV